MDEIKKSLVKFLSDGQKDNKNYDKKIIMESTIDDVDDEAYNLFFDNLKDDDSYKKFRNDDDKSYSLQRSGAGEEINGVFHLNVAGALFFAKDVNKFLSHEMKMVRFKGISKFDAIDRVDSTSSLLKLLEDFEKFYKTISRSGFFIEGVERVNVDEYPIRAIREAIINAIAHRNYEISSSFIEFYMCCISVLVFCIPENVDYGDFKWNYQHYLQSACDNVADAFYIDLERISSGFTKKLRRRCNDHF